MCSPSFYPLKTYMENGIGISWLFVALTCKCILLLVVWWIFECFRLISWNSQANRFQIQVMTINYAFDQNAIWIKFLLKMIVISILKRMLWVSFVLHLLIFFYLRNSICVHYKNKTKNRWMFKLRKLIAT